MSEQPFLFGDAPWIEIKDGNDTARSLFHRHYSRYVYKDGRKPLLFVGPGEKIVLLSPDARALFVWRKMNRPDLAGQSGVNNSVFRNERTTAGRSSDLILAAKEIAWERWPGERLYTYVDPSKVRHKRDPGRCFLRAGFKVCGTSKSGKLILESFPESSALPDSVSHT